MYREGQHSWITWIKKRIANNLNFICLFQGATGIGKTWSAISMSYMLDNEFSSNQIVFEFKELMDVINSDWFKQKKIKIIIFDEPQITISNRNWQSTVNKMMNYLLSTFRHQNIILIFCSPYRDFLDSQSMKLLHCVFECEGINKKTNMSRVRPKIQQYNSYMKKTYQHALFVIKGKKTIPLRDWYVPKPPIHLVNEYESKKTLFTDKLNQEIRRKVEELTTVKKPMTLPNGFVRRPLTKKQEEVMRILAYHTQEETAKILKVHQTAIHSSKELAMKKGYTVEEFKERDEKDIDKPIISVV